MREEDQAQAKNDAAEERSVEKNNFKKWHLKRGKLKDACVEKGKRKKREEEEGGREV